MVGVITTEMPSLIIDMIRPYKLQYANEILLRFLQNGMHSRRILTDSTVLPARSTWGEIDVRSRLSRDRVTRKYTSFAPKVRGGTKYMGWPGKGFLGVAGGIIYSAPNGGS